MKISYKLDNEELQLLKEVEEITGADYEIKGDLISAEKFIDIVKDLKVEIGVLQEKLENALKHE